MFKAKKLIIIIVIFLVGGGLIANYIIKKNKAEPYNFVIAEKGNVIQEVSVTGLVKPAQNVDLAFEKIGKVSNVYVKVGDKVKIGQTLVILNNRDIAAQLLQAEAGLEAEQAKLSEIKKGTRPEEIQAAETEISNAEKSLNDAQINLENVKNKASADLQNVYNVALTTIQKSVTIGKSALMTLSDVQLTHFNGTDADSNKLADAKAVAIKSLLGAENKGRLNSEFISELNGGAFGIVQDTVNNPTYDNIDNAILKTSGALQDVLTALNTIPVNTLLTSTEKTNVSTEKTNVSTEINTISTKKEAIMVQKMTNNSNIATAEASVNTAQNTLLSAQDDLNLKKAGYTLEQISNQEAKVKSAQANVENYRAQLAKTIISSPINGIVTKQEAKIGEIVSANSTLVSIISEAKFEIEAHIPEADIAKVKINDDAKVTLDAYGNEVVFEVKVTSIDPAETVIEGVSTYKTKFQFIKEDEKIKSGMTANIDIATANRENVVVVPQRVVVSKNGDKIVRIAEGKNIKEIKVKTGLIGSDGNVEIIDGIKEGDKVITFIKGE